MGSKAIAFLCLMALLLTIASEVTARDLAAESETKGLEESKYGGGGGGGGGGCWRCGGGGGGGGGHHCGGYGCCGHGWHGCRCCSYAGEPVDPGYVPESVEPHN